MTPPSMRDLIQITEGAGAPSEVVVWHGTNDPDIEFRPWIHFGTMRAAAQRLLFTAQRAREYGWPEKPALMIEARLSLRRVVRITDDAGYDLDPNAIIAKLLKKRETPKAVKTVLAELPNMVPFAELNDVAKRIVEAGLDGVVYLNRSEDRGSLSYVVFDPSRIQVINGPSKWTDTDLLWAYRLNSLPNKFG